MTTITKIANIVYDNINDVKDESFYKIAAAHFSNLVYHKPKTIKKNLDKLNAVKSNLYIKDGTQALFAEFNDFAIVSFSGISLKQSDDIKITLRFWKSPFLNTRVHNGFARSMDRVSDDIITDLRSVPRHKKIIYTGHSLGGAMATLMAMMEKPHKMIVFGTPSVSYGKEYREYFRGIDHDNFMHRWDFVTYLPPVFLFYRHVGRKHRIKGPGLKHSHYMTEYMKSMIKLYWDK